jgi:hypothetical protein
MKTLIGIIITAVSVAIGYPLLNEDASNVCSALERCLIILESQREGNQAATALLVALQNSLSNGSFAMSFVKLQHSDLGIPSARPAAANPPCSTTRAK